MRSHSIGSCETISGSFVSILIWIPNRYAGSFAPVRDITTVGTPLVELGVEDCRRDPDALLPPRLPYLVEPRTVEELAKDKRHLGGNDPGTVVLDDDPEDLIGHFPDADKNIRKDLRLLTGIQRVIHGLLDGGDHPAGGGIKTEEVLVLLEEFRDADAALLPGQLVSEHHTMTPRRSLREGPGLSVPRCAGS